VIREDLGRLIVRCNRCPAQLDLGPAHVARARNRTPSGWIKTAGDTHYCPLCSPNVSAAAVFAHAAGVRAQPLL
jgi:hypothetical protein